MKIRFSENDILLGDYNVNTDDLDQAILLLEANGTKCQEGSVGFLFHSSVERIADGKVHMADGSAVEYEVLD